MSGHNKWAQIKHQKGVTDQRRGQLFSKLVSAITVAAKNGSDPHFNPRLRSAIEKAKEHSVPNDNIERAIKRASGAAGGLDELLFEAYDKSGAALIVSVATDNRNRSVAEIKKILSDHGGKLAAENAVRWLFESVPDGGGGVSWRPKFFRDAKEEDLRGIRALIADLHQHDEVSGVWADVAL